MNAMLTVVAAHGVERIVAVSLGGLAVYYGFRLFLVLPIETQSDGKIRLPGMSVVLSKAGPGLFFLAFGALVILASLFRPVHIVTDQFDYAGFAAEPPKHDPSGPSPAATGAPSEQDTVRAVLALQSINCMQRLSARTARDMSGDFDQAAREAKLALLARVWNSGKWGDFGSFERWAAGRANETTSPAKALFSAERTDCPK